MSEGFTAAEADALIKAGYLKYADGLLVETRKGRRLREKAEAKARKA